jgi:hypothetical protein
MEDGLPGLPQLVQELSALKQHVTIQLVQELGNSGANIEQRPGLLLEELYLQIATLRRDLDRLCHIFSANNRSSADQNDVALARQAVDRLATAVMTNGKVRAELLGQGGDPQEAARLWESARVGVLDIGRE